MIRGPMSRREPETDSTSRVHLCGPADREAQARLYNLCFKKRLDPGALAWRYDESPHGASVSLVARNEAGLEVSGYACSPRLALSKGDEATCARLGETGDVMTHPEWRSRGLFSALDRACREETKRLGWPAMIGLPNRRSAHIFLDLGWKRVGTVRPWTFLLKDEQGARRERAREGRLQGWLVPLGVRKGRAARAKLVERAGKRFQARALERFPPEVEALSRAVEKRFALMVRRDAAWLDWRFARSPSGRHRALGIFAENGALAAYAVVQLPRPGESTGWLVDALARDDDALAAAVLAGLERLELQGASVVQAHAVDGSWWCERLQEAGFLPPKASHHLIVIAWPNDSAHPLAQAALDARGWYLTDGDRDDETVG
jgi:GNAT superfamily N-acetyltransferase